MDIEEIFMNDITQAKKKSCAQLSPNPGLADRVQQVLEKQNRPAQRVLSLKPVLAIGLILLLVVLSGILIKHLVNRQQIQSIQTPDKTEDYLWPALNLAEGVSMADYIVYGRVTNKHPLGPETRVNVAVIQVLKTSSSVPAELEEISYYEIPPAADGTIDDIPPILFEGQEVVLFLNRIARALSPDFVVPVKEGRAEITPFLKRNSVFADLKDHPSIETFCDQILYELNAGD